MLDSGTKQYRKGRLGRGQGREPGPGRRPLPRDLAPQSYVPVRAEPVLTADARAPGLPGLLGTFQELAHRPDVYDKPQAVRFCTFLRVTQ